jgi:heme oxygenase
VLAHAYGHELEVFASPASGALAVVPRREPATAPSPTVPFRPAPEPAPPPAAHQRSTMTTVDQSTSSAGFAQAVRAATWGDHQAAEGAGYIRALVAGELDRDAYARLVDQHWHIYSVLEAAIDVMRADPVVGGFATASPPRLAHLEADLAVLRGPDWRAQADPLDATVAYCEQMRAVCFDWPGGFVAHHYTRFLGDLSGGIFIGRAIEGTFQFAPRAGASFYRYDDGVDPAALREEYRTRLDTAPWDDAEQQRIIDEVVGAYRHNRAVFEALAATLEG